jgi:group I intron endonuclease
MDCNLHWKDKSKGVYFIVNQLNKDKYIGSTINTFYNRFRNHKSQLKSGKHNSPILLNAVNKYGLDSFLFVPMKRMKDDEKIIETEALLIEMLKPKYNCAMKVRHGGKPNLGRKFSQEWKNNIKRATSGYTHSEKVRKKVAQNNKKNACSCKFIKDNKELEFNSWVEAAKHFGLSSPASFHQAINKYNGKWKGWKIERLSRQRKGVRLYLDDEIKEFKSMAACDRYLDTWRGKTSKCLNRGDKEIFGYKVEKIG